MKNFAAFALVVLSCVPAKAQMGGMGGARPAAPAQNIEVEILEMEQEADKAALKEALLLHSREGLRKIQGAEAEKKQHLEEGVALHDFIAEKKEAVTSRAAEISKKRTAGRRGPAMPPAQQREGGDKQDAVESYEKAKIEAQLLEVQVNRLQPELAKAIETLAAADLAAGDDQTGREKAEAARKAYDKIKAKVVELNKRLYQELQIVMPMQMQMQSMGMGGMGGMGGGFR